MTVAHHEPIDTAGSREQGKSQVLGAMGRAAVGSHQLTAESTEQRA